MRFFTISLAVIPFGVVAVSADFSAAQPEKIVPIQQWTGKSQNTADLALAPENGVIVDAKTWKRVWTAWQGEVKLPDVNFAKQVVLVGTVRGPNRVFVNVSVDDQGDVKMVTGGTKMGGPGFGFAFLQVSRLGIVSVKGNRIGHVELRGMLNSQVFAIGGETTGATITDDGTTWELDFGQNKKLRKLATVLHEKQVDVTGELTVKRGIEIQERSIVKVATLQAAGAGPKGNEF